MLTKPQRSKDANYLSYVRGMRCLVCGDTNTDPHHLISRGSFGSDYTAIPLCREHHTELHSSGITKFEEKYSINLWKDAFKLLETYFEESKKETHTR